MKNILTLISDPQRPCLTETIVTSCAARLTDVTAVSWLSENVAVDIFFEGDLALAKDSLTPDLEHENLDFLFQTSRCRKKKLLIADMDSTIIQCEVIDEMADFVGLKEKISALTAAAMQGNADFEQTLRDRVALLEGMDAALLEKVYQERVRLTPGARSLIQTMKANGAMTLLVSGGFTFFTSRIADKTGFQVNRANNLEIKAGKLTGRLLPPIVDSATKLNSLMEFRDKAGLAVADTMAVGDGSNDVAMIKAAGLGVAFYPKPVVARAADMVIRHADLTALLYLQGYGDQDFAG